MPKNDSDSNEENYLDDIEQVVISELEEKSQEKTEIRFGYDLVNHFSTGMTKDQWRELLVNYRSQPTIVEKNKHQFLDALYCLTVRFGVSIANKKNNPSLAEAVIDSTRDRLMSQAMKNAGVYLSDYDINKGAAVTTYVYRQATWAFSDAADKSIDERIVELASSMYGKNLSLSDLKFFVMKEKAHELGFDLGQEIDRVAKERRIKKDVAKREVYRRVVASSEWTAVWSNVNDINQEIGSGNEYNENDKRVNSEKAIDCPDSESVNLQNFSTHLRSPIRVAKLRTVFEELGNLFVSIDFGFAPNHQRIWNAYWGMTSPKDYLHISIENLAIKLGLTTNQINPMIKKCMDSWLSPPPLDSKHHAVNEARRKFSELAKKSYQLLLPERAIRNYSDERIREHQTNFPKLVLQSTEKIRRNLRKNFHTWLDLHEHNLT